MHVIKKINLKLFLPVSLGTLLIFSLFCNGLTEILVLIGVHVATLLNLYMLMFVVDRLLLSPEVLASKNIDKFKVVSYFLLKIFVIFFALSLGVHFIGNRIIIPLINYVIQIFVLGISLKR